MRNKNKFLIFGLSALIAMNITMGNVYAQVDAAKTESFEQVNPVELVANPATFLNRKIKIVAAFDKFSTLGLDYKPALRDSKKYIALLIKRSDVAEGYTIPLSELKLIIPREKAEKLIDLESGDQIELTGVVFSSALSDPWVDVSEIKILSSKAKSLSAGKPISDKSSIDKSSTAKNLAGKKPSSKKTKILNKKNNM